MSRPLTEAAIETLFEVVKASLSRGETIYIRGFGNFQNKKRAKRQARHIKNNTSVEVEACEYPGFKPSKLFIEKIRTELKSI
ncbi:MAG: HU family DNA-binding protein [Spirosomataceae bacterium]